jgi:hypothetical protein
VGWLLDEIRKNGETSELKDEVVRLARAHGIVTPYTAYLILEDEARRGVPVAVRTMRELEQDVRARDAAETVYRQAAGESTALHFRGGGDLAVANANNLGVLKDSENLTQAGQGFALDKGGSFGVANGPAAGAGGGAGGRDPAAPAIVAGTTASGGYALTPPASAAPGEKLELSKNLDGTVELKAPATRPGLLAAGIDAKNLPRRTEGTDEPAYGYRAKQNYAQQARVVRGRAFYQNGNVWTDATAASSKTELKRREVKFDSDAYYALLGEHPEAAAWFALGNEVDVVIGEELVVVR